MSWNTHGISDISITWQFRLAVGWISRQYIHHYFAKIKADFATGHFINAMTIRCIGHSLEDNYEFFKTHN
jgi:hypothetical protein